MQRPYHLYAAEFSLYSGKVRAYLRQKGIPFVEINPSWTVYRRFIVPRTGVRFIPVLHSPDDQVIQDSSAIIDFLEQRFPEHPVYPHTARQVMTAQLLEVYGDEWLLIPAMHYRWNYAQNHRFLYREFGNMLAPKLPGFMRQWLGQRIGSRFADMLPRLGITQHTRAAIEKSYVDLLDDLQLHFTAHDYLLGQRPCIGDFGMIAPLYAHLYRDPYPGQLMRQRAPAVAAWVERMLQAQAMAGTFLADDDVPRTLLPILRRMAVEQLPVLMKTDAKLAEWGRQHSLTCEIPRTLGHHSFDIDGVEEQRVILPHSLWKWQRVMSRWRTLDATEQLDCKPLLQSVGLLPAFNHHWQCQLQRRHNRHYLTPSSDALP